MEQNGEYEDSLHEDSGFDDQAVTHEHNDQGTPRSSDDEYPEQSDEGTPRSQEKEYSESEGENVEYENDDEREIQGETQTDYYEEDGELIDQNVEGKSRILVLELVSDEGMVTHTMKLEVVDTMQRKPFLGGYRHKKSGLEYHHATAQTVFLPKADKVSQDGKRVRKFHRCTQTVKTKTRSQQTYREQGTQMEKDGLSIDHSRDRVYIPTGQYFSADAFIKLRTQYAIKIQAFVRGWRARRRAAQEKNKKEDTEQRNEEQTTVQEQREIAKKRKEIKRRMHPEKKHDFEILYSELEQWRLQETERIKEESETEREKQLGLIDLLRKETKLLQTIDRLKQSSHAENKEKRIHQKLEYLAKPLKIKNWNGEHTFIETPFTVRAQELMDLYHGLNTPNLSVDERLDVLLHVKWTVKEFDCILTRDIVELIDREADLLNRGRKDKALLGLRKRLLNLFLQFIETPEFNPLASKLPTSKTNFTNAQPLN